MGKHAILTSSLEKRIKRNVLARKQHFFVITSPGLESLCRKELTRLPSFSGETTVVSGGVEFSGKLYDGYLANLHLRTATRILMRIDTVSASHFTQLSKKLAEIPWELYLHPDAACAIGCPSMPVFCKPKTIPSFNSSFSFAAWMTGSAFP